MDRLAIREGLSAFGVTQLQLARAAGRSEACISRQLSGSLRLTEHVAATAEGLLAQRGAQVAQGILAWVEGRGTVTGSEEGSGNDAAD
jgi:DNA transposition AAA+ family ATPase